VRNSKDPLGHALMFTREEWAAFLAGDRSRGVRRRAVVHFRYSRRMSEPLPPPGYVPTYVYRFFTTDGEVLYIGCTRSLDRRFAKHRSNYADEWHLVAGMTVEVYADRYVAENAERVAILRENPRWNRLKAYPSPRVPDAELAEVGVPLKQPEQPVSSPTPMLLNNEQGRQARPAASWLRRIAPKFAGWWEAGLARNDLSIVKVPDGYVLGHRPTAPDTSPDSAAPSVATTAPQRALSKEDSLDAVLNALLGISRPALCREVAERVDRSDPLTRARLAELVALGRVERLGEGRWSRYKPAELPCETKQAP
jgi:predicted GIY-YIG superfamily endonuclease